MNPFISAAEKEAHRRALSIVQDAGIDVLVGGAYAMFHYTGQLRWTKDLDLFIPREEEARVRETLAGHGFRTEVHDPVWLSKAYWNETYIDLIYSSGNGIAAVDQEWITCAPTGDVLGLAAKLVPPEEMIWSKGFVQERERWDGADVNHLIRNCGHSMDWQRLMRRYEPHWEILLAHLTLFSFSYPHDRDVVPRWVWRRLLGRAARSRARPPEEGKVCRGTLLSRVQYTQDIASNGYLDARDLELAPEQRPQPRETESPAALPLAVATEA